MLQVLSEDADIKCQDKLPIGFKNTKYSVIPADWGFKKVKRIFTRVKNPVDVKEEEEYIQIGIRSHGKGIFYKESVKGKQLGSKAVFWVEPNCFIVNIVFAWEIAVAKTTQNEVGYIASHRFPMYRPKEKFVDLDFITYLFKSPRGKYLLSLASPGGAGRNKTLGQKEFSEIEVLLPRNVDEQKKIASILSTWDKAIELKEKLIEQKKEQKKGLMQKLLTGEERLPGFDGEWKEVFLSQICIHQSGKRPKGGASTKGDIPSLGGENIYSDNGLNLSVIKKVPKKFFSKMNSGILQENDILLNKDGAQTGKVALYKNSGLDTACINEHLFLIRPNVGISYKFLYYYLSSTEGQRKIKVRITSSAQPGLNSKFVNGFTLKIPCYQEQCYIGDILYIVDQELNLLKKELELLKQQKKGLMQLLLTGKVRVKV